MMDDSDISDRSFHGSGSELDDESDAAAMLGIERETLGLQPYRIEPEVVKSDTRSADSQTQLDDGCGNGVRMHRMGNTLW